MKCSTSQSTWVHLEGSVQCACPPSSAAVIAARLRCGVLSESSTVVFLHVTIALLLPPC